MKHLRWLIILALLAGYFLWPYHATSKYARAVEEQDAATMMAMTDQAALRDSLEDLFVESTVIREIELRGRKIDEASLRARARQHLETPAMQRHIDAAMSVENLRARLAAGPKFEKGATVWRDEKWASPWEFSVGDRQGGRLIFRFKGLGWKHSGFEFSKEELRRLTAAQGR